MFARINLSQFYWELYKCLLVLYTSLYFFLDIAGFQSGYHNPPTTTSDYDYYEAYFSGTVSILAPNNWHKSGDDKN